MFVWLHVQFVGTCNKTYRWETLLLPNLSKVICFCIYISNSQDNTQKIKSFKRNQCSKTFFNQTSLTKLVNATHSNKKYKCSLCEKYFSSKNYLLCHIQSHTVILHDKLKSSMIWIWYSLVIKAHSLRFVLLACMLYLTIFKKIYLIGNDKLKWISHKHHLPSYKRIVSCSLNNQHEIIWFSITKLLIKFV